MILGTKSYLIYGKAIIMEKWEPYDAKSWEIFEAKPREHGNLDMLCKNQQAADGSPDEQTFTADFASPNIRKSSKLCSLQPS